MNSSDEGVVGMEIRAAGSPVLVLVPPCTSAGVPALVGCDDDGACWVEVMAM